MIELKHGIPCADCHHVFPAWVMQWDHLPGTAKVTEIAEMVGHRPRAAILEEIAKCQLVCANCHAIRTRRRATRRRPGDGDATIAEDQRRYRSA
jgi:hypothetical protein